MLKQRLGDFQYTNNPQISLSVPIYYAGFGQIIGRHLNRDLITRINSDISHPHLTAEIGVYHNAILQLNPKSHIRQEFYDFTV